jgi:uncharacterized protein with GYD domain
MGPPLYRIRTSENNPSTHSLDKLPVDAPDASGWHHAYGVKGRDPRVRWAGEGRRSTRMPRYVVLANWTDRGIRDVKHTTERMDHGGEVAEKHGSKLEQAYWTVGSYDMVTVIEAPDDEALSAYLLEIASSGNVRTTTLRAYDEEEMSGILRRLG